MAKKLSYKQHYYRLELLDKKLKSEESTSYLNFLKETGIEMVMIPFTKKSNEKIKKTIKELYTCE